MPKPARLRRIDEDRLRGHNPIVFILTLGRHRWSRVPPWRPRSPWLPPPRVALPAPIVPDADITCPDKLPAIVPNRQPETAL